MKNKKQMYLALILASLVLMSADGGKFLSWLIWELCCFAVLLFSIYMYQVEKERN